MKDVIEKAFSIKWKLEDQFCNNISKALEDLINLKEDARSLRIQLSDKFSNGSKTPNADEVISGIREACMGFLVELSNTSNTLEEQRTKDSERQGVPAGEITQALKGLSNLLGDNIVPRAIRLITVLKNPTLTAAIENLANHDHQYLRPDVLIKLNEVIDRAENIREAAFLLDSNYTLGRLYDRVRAEMEALSKSTRELVNHAPPEIETLAVDVKEACQAIALLMERVRKGGYSTSAEHYQGELISFIGPASSLSTIPRVVRYKIRVGSASPERKTKPLSKRLGLTLTEAIDRVGTTVSTCEDRPSDTIAGKFDTFSTAAGHVREGLRRGLSKQCDPQSLKTESSMANLSSIARDLFELSMDKHSFPEAMQPAVDLVVAINEACQGIVRWVDRVEKGKSYAAPGVYGEILEQLCDFIGTGSPPGAKQEVGCWGRCPLC